MGVYDDSGNSCFSFMISKMPNIAMEGIEQFHKIRMELRKHYYYLSHLEKDAHFLDPMETEENGENHKNRKGEEEKLIAGQKAKKQKTFAKTPLEVKPICIISQDHCDSS